MSYSNFRLVKCGTPWLHFGKRCDPAPPKGARERAPRQEKEEEEKLYLISLRNAISGKSDRL